MLPFVPSVMFSLLSLSTERQFICARCSTSGAECCKLRLQALHESLRSIACSVICGSALCWRFVTRLCHFCLAWYTSTACAAITLNLSLQSLKVRLEWELLYSIADTLTSVQARECTLDPTHTTQVLLFVAAGSSQSPRAFVNARIIRTTNVFILVHGNLCSLCAWMHL